MPMRSVPFTSWWCDPVLKDVKGRKFSRLDLVSHVADTDGGAHVDPSLDEAYMALSRQNSLGWVLGDGRTPLEGRPELACARQIAHEVLTTLRDLKGVSGASPVLPSTTAMPGATVGGMIFEQVPDR